jgi:hypothetical protein
VGGLDDLCGSRRIFWLLTPLSNAEGDAELRGDVEPWVESSGVEAACEASGQAVFAPRAIVASVTVFNHFTISMLRSDSSSVSRELTTGEFLSRIICTEASHSTF